jgi:muramidase (phage lysozyme)
MFHIEQAALAKLVKEWTSVYGAKEGPIKKDMLKVKFCSIDLHSS